MICSAWFLFKLIRELANNVVDVHTRAGEEVDRTTVDGLSKVSRIVVVVVAVLGSMQTLGFSVSGILASGGMGGIAVGFAAKDLLANFFGGLTIYLDRPFNVGEMISSPDRQIEGRVDLWAGATPGSAQSTWLRFTSPIPCSPPSWWKSSRMSHRRISETIGRA